MSDEWLACLDELIKLTNIGKLSIRIRGRKRTRIAETLAALRKKTSELVLAEGERTKVKFEGVEIDEWKADNPGRDPYEECMWSLRCVQMFLVRILTCAVVLQSQI